MEAKYNPETTNSTAASWDSGAWKTIRYVNFPKFSTIETYDDLIKYVEEMYVNGMILGDEVVIKPDQEQSGKLINSTYLALYGSQKIGEPCGFHEHYQKDGFEIQTSFGVKIIIK